MIKVYFKASFARLIQKLEPGLCQEILEKSELLKDKKNHTSLKVHKLHGKLSGYFSFSVNYKTRVVFMYESKTEIVLLMVGNHDMYQ